MMQTMLRTGHYFETQFYEVEAKLNERLHVSNRHSSTEVLLSTVAILHAHVILAVHTLSYR
jgi:hypothetical protein